MITGDLQACSDVTLFSEHPDPQVKGGVAHLLTNFVHASLTVSGGKFERWLRATNSSATASAFISHTLYTVHCAVLFIKSLFAEAPLKMADVVDTLSALLQDDASQASRLTVVALKSCLPTMLRSEHSDDAVRLLHLLLALRSSPYWLTKV